MDTQTVVSAHTECYAAFKGKGVLTSATMWVALEDIMVSEISQTQKDKHCVITLLRRI